MRDHLESQLRAVLHDEAARVPSSSTDRLTRLHYHPRASRLRPPVAVGALAGAVGTAGAVVAVISLGAGASNAFAGWTATPTIPSPQQLAAAGQDCQQRSPIAGLPLKLTDTRGPFTFSVYADSTSSAICISGPSFTSVSGSISTAPAGIPDGSVQLSSSHQTNRDGQGYSFADGHTGAGVSAVALTLDDGAAVQATVDNGWFVAWWPGAHVVKSAQITTPSGVKTQTFDSRHESPCGPKLCTGGGVAINGNGPVSGHVHGSSSSSSAGGPGRPGAPMTSFGVSQQR